MGVRVLFFVESLSENTITFINRQLNDVKKSNEVRVLSFDSKSRSIDDLYISKPRIYDSRFFKRLELSDIYLSRKSREFTKEFDRIISSFKPELIHCQFGTDALWVLENYKGKVPVLIHFRGYDASLKMRMQTYNRKMKKYLSKENIYSVFVCHALKNNMYNSGVSFYNYPKVIYSNTDVAFFKLIKVKKANIFTFIQVSSFREKKGHIYTLRAFAKFLLSNNKKSQLIFTGSGGNIDKVKHEAKRLNILDYVHFTGWVDKYEARNLLQRAHVAVQHSITDQFGDQEGIPNFLMEAMSMELPIISTNHSGIPELVNDSENGVLVYEKDIDSYASAMEFYFNNWKLYPHNRQKIINKFERKEHVKKLNELYQEILL